MNLKFIRNNHFLFLLILIVLTIPAIYSLMNNGFFQSDDGEWMIIRFSAFFQSLKDGQIPVRFLGRLNHGYGYPVANFLYPGFMYLGIPIHILGFGFVDTVKIILGLSMIVSAVFSFLWLSKIFNKYSAFVGALFYLYTPYHLYDLYKRGSVGEILALGIIPFILWMIEKKNIFFTSIGIFLLIISHNTIAFLFLPVLFFYSLLRKLMSIKSVLLCLIFGILLSSFFIIPAIFELRYVRFSNVLISDITKYFSSFNLIGLSSLIVLITSTVLFFINFNKIKSDKNLISFFTMVCFLSTFFSLEVSKSFWNFLPSSFIQFPFRFLSYLLVSLSFLSAFIISQFKDLKKYIISLVLILVLGYSVFPFLKPEAFFDKEESFYATNEGTTTVQDEYLPIWVKNKPTEHFKNKVEIIEGKMEINDLIYNSKKIVFNFSSIADSKIRINTIYYPGWKAYVNEERIKIDYSNDRGVMDLLIPKGNHEIKLIFSETPLGLVADFMSISSFVILIFFAKVYKIK